MQKKHGFRKYKKDAEKLIKSKSETINKKLEYETTNKKLEDENRKLRSELHIKYHRGVDNERYKKEIQELKESNNAEKEKLENRIKGLVNMLNEGSIERDELSEEIKELQDRIKIVDEQENTINKLNKEILELKYGKINEEPAKENLTANELLELLEDRDQVDLNW